MDIIETLQERFPHLTFHEAELFSWSPETKEVFYDATKPVETRIWSLLHETGHALLEHKSYRADLELIKLEIAAWEKAKELADEFDLEIDEDHIQDCLDTYRDWLYQRSVCPRCNNKSLQQEDVTYYQCFNCHTAWKVTPSRFCRAYRATQKARQPSAVFYATDTASK
ncbi:MAG TPA: ImmA/IrrE family metallo-endopeptidase [Candidatus Saccharimonadales bacterium]|nr:ImmA/IrrE family metallo-endopeptidase [Candidatus Saccharimonadales bacterium]